MSTISINELVDIDVLRKMVNSLYDAAGIPVGILDDQGDVLAMVGWRNFCKNSHMVYLECQKKCSSSLNYIINNVWKGTISYKCQNGLNEIGVPVNVDGFHVATIIIGQFWYEDEVIDEAFFKTQAKECGLDEEKYISEIHNLPRYSSVKLNSIMDYYKDLLSMLIESNMIKMKFNKVKNQVDKKQKGLRMLNLLYSNSSKIVELQDRLESVHRIILDTLNVDYVSIYIYDEVYKMLVLYSATGLSEEFASLFKHVSPGEGIMGKTYLEKQRNMSLAKNIPDQEHVPSYINEGIKLAGSYPILFQKNCLGVICFGYKRIAVFTEEDHFFLDSICNFIAIILNNSILMNQLKKELEDRINLQQNLSKVNCEAENAIEEAKRVRSVFRYNLSHELRTPINGIFGMVQLLEMEDLNEEQKSTVNVLKESTQKMIELINNISEMIMIETGQITKQERIFKVDEILMSLADIFHNRLLEKNISFEYVVSCNMPSALVGDVEKISIILKQIVDNAIKFTDEGNVMISAEAVFLTENSEELELCFSITDTGIGFDMSKISQLFQPYTQGDESYTRQHGGFGLGLAISHDLARVLSGKIEVSSKPNQGSTFTVKLPVKKAQVEVEPAYSFYEKELKAFIF